MIACIQFCFNFAFKFNLRRYNKVYSAADVVFSVVNATFHSNVVAPKSLARGFLRTSTPPTFNLILLLLLLRASV